MLDAKIKQFKKGGLQNTSHKPAIELEDLEKLKNSEILSLTQPWSLLRNVWFHISLFWCRRGFEGQRRFKRRSLTFDVDSKGDYFVSMTHDESTKNHPGRVSDAESFEKMQECTKPAAKQMAALVSKFFSQNCILNAKRCSNIPIEIGGKLTRYGTKIAR